jgi:plasmid stability protein
MAPDQHEALREEAARSGQTVSEFIRQILAAHVAGPRSPATAAHVIRRVKPPRRLSRPVRLQRAISDIEDLLADYEAWRDNLPESLQSTATAASLDDTIENLQQAADALNSIVPPRGFGRD